MPSPRRAVPPRVAACPQCRPHLARPRRAPRPAPGPAGRSQTHRPLVLATRAATTADAQPVPLLAPIGLVQRRRLLPGRPGGPPGGAVSPGPPGTLDWDRPTVAGTGAAGGKGAMVRAGRGTTGSGVGGSTAGVAGGSAGTGVGADGGPTVVGGAGGGPAVSAGGAGPPPGAGGLAPPGAGEGGAEGGRLARRQSSGAPP